MNIRTVLTYPTWYLPALRYTIIMSVIAFMGEVIYPSFGWASLLTAAGLVGWGAFYKKEVLFHDRLVEYAALQSEERNTP